MLYEALEERCSVPTPFMFLLIFSDLHNRPCQKGGTAHNQFFLKYILHFILFYSTLIFPFFLFSKFEWFMNVNPYMVVQLWDIAGKLKNFFHTLTRRKWTFEQWIIYLTFFFEDLIINFTSSAILLAVSKRSTLHHLTSLHIPLSLPHESTYTPHPCLALHLSWSVSHAGFVRVSTCKKQVSVNSYLT